MASSAFTPPEEIVLFCRFCKKVVPASLDRSIAGSGRTVDKESTFEYTCTKCNKSFCICGNDVIANDAAPQEDQEAEVREYEPNEFFLIGETIRHPKLKDTGRVVGKEIGTPQTIIVEFEKKGVRKLVENVA